ASFALALTATFSVSAAKPMTNFGRCVFRLAIVARMSGFSTSASSGTVLPGCFFNFCSRVLATRQSATAAAKIAMSAGSVRSTARVHHFARRFDLDHLDTLRVGDTYWARHQHDICTSGGRRGRDGVALLAGRAVGDIAYRVDRLVGRSGCDQHAPALQQLCAFCGEEFLRGEGNFRWLCHAT